MTGELPLSRFRVLDLTRVRSGPTAVRQLADWGADVIKVESPQGEAELSGGRDGSDFQNLQRNKRSIAIDLKRKEGQDVLLRAAARADVLVENFRPDVKHRLGIDYATLSRIHPRLVYASISGFGEDGPYRDRPGLDQVVQGMGGLMSVTGLPGQGPVRAGIAVADSAAGLYCAFGILAALLERERTGKGRWVQTSLLAAQIALMDFQAARWLVDGDVPGQAGNDHPVATPMGLFEAADGHVNIAAHSETMFRKFCEVAGESRLLGDPRFSSHRARYANRAALNDEVKATIKKRTVAYWIERLNAAGVPAGPVYALDQVFADPGVKYIGMARSVTHPARGDIALVGQPVRFSDLDPGPRTVAPRLGEHTQTILRELDYSPQEIAALRRDNIIAGGEGP
ncbi:MAG: CoA transferase [Alphaproteobacteria bacterium]|nr:CoA transferase [Alphaproteobacteria bacterium]